MKFLQRFTLKSIGILLLSIITTSTTLAGPPPTIGTMTYSVSGATGIPTLSGTMLILLSLLLFAVAFRVARQKGAGKMFITLIGVGALTMGGSGIKLVSDAKALMGIPLPLPLDPESTTGQQNVVEGYNVFINRNTNTVTIQTITTPGYDCIDPIAGSAKAATTAATAPPPIQVCAQGVSLPNEAQCEMYCVNTAVSDIRLKQDINYLGRLNNGLRLYAFKYLANYYSSEETYVGVMAQDLLKDPRFKDAVLTMNNNYYAVNYGALGLNMVTLKQWEQSPESIRNESNQTSYSEPL